MKAQPGSRIESRDPEHRTGDSPVTEWIEQASPRARARITGVVYLLFFLTALFYQLFRPVSRSLALLAAFFGLVGCAITAFGSLCEVLSA
jgi:hypothetical protein